MAEGRIIRTCRCLLIALAAIATASPALAAGDLTAFVRARAADGDGRVDQAAAAYAQALTAAPDNLTVARRAYREALRAGDDKLALRAIAVLTPAGAAPFDAALFVYADALHRTDVPAMTEAMKRIDEGPFDFLLPALRAWRAFAAGGDALTPLDAAGSNPIARRYAAETRALLLIAMGKPRDGVLAAQGLLGTDQASTDFRINAAQLLAGAGEGTAARSLLSGDTPPLPAARDRLGKGVRATAAVGVSRLFTRLAADIATGSPTPFSITVARAALLLEPGNDRARLLLGRALGQAGADERALAALDAVPAVSIYRDAALQARIALLQEDGDTARALSAAEALARAKNADAAAISRYGDLLMSAERYDDAVRAYTAVIDRPGAAADWSQHLQLGGAFDQAGRWTEARAELERAYALAPDQPVVLNYLAYALIEHGERLGEAEAMLERANRLNPGDFSILDSLAWAYFTRGDARRALPLLERAAQGQPANVTINEHLGDAYWTVGRRYEARYAWRAATIVADAGEATRLAGKIAAGLPE